MMYLWRLGALAAALLFVAAEAQAQFSLATDCAKLSMRLEGIREAAGARCGGGEYDGDEFIDASGPGTVFVIRHQRGGLKYNLQREEVTHIVKKMVDAGKAQDAGEPFEVEDFDIVRYKAKAEGTTAPAACFTFLNYAGTSTIRPATATPSSAPIATSPATRRATPASANCWARSTRTFGEGERRPGLSRRNSHASNPGGTVVIVRAWRGLAPSSNPRAYSEHFTRKVLPELKSIEGFLGASLLRQDGLDGVQFLVLTRWASMDAIRAFAGDDVGKAVVEPEAEAALLNFDRTVQHYEVVLEISR